MPELLPLLLLPLTWFLLIRPQRRRVAARQQLVASLQVGDEVVTAGGLLGHVVGVEADRVRIEVAAGVMVEVVPAAVTARAPRSTRPVGDAA